MDKPDTQHKFMGGGPSTFHTLDVIHVGNEGEEGQGTLLEERNGTVTVGKYRTNPVGPLWLPGVMIPDFHCPRQLSKHTVTFGQCQEAQSQ